MQVLFVTAYEPLNGKRKKSVPPNELLLRSIKNAFREVRKQFPISSLNMRRDGHDPNNYILRNYDEISDMVVDWHHDNIDDKARKKLKNFDKIDMIIIGGDMKGVLPWDPQAMQAVTLLHMAITAKKPVLAVGFGAFLYIYSLATQGCKYHMLNGPGGDVNPTENLPVFPNFARPTGQYPGGWMDHSSGDVYCYYDDKRFWKPVVNVGIHRYPLKVVPYSPRAASVSATTPMTTTTRTDGASHAFEFNFNFNYPRPTTAATAMALDEKVVVIRKHMLHHPFLKGVSDVAAGCNSNPRNFSPRGPAPPLTYLTFLMRTYPFWFINSDGSLPAGRAGLQVLAECDEGPVILCMDNASLLLAVELEESRSCYPIAYHLIHTFVAHTLTQLIPQHPILLSAPTPTRSAPRPTSASTGNSSSQQSLFVLLLGSGGWERDARYDSSKHHGPANLPLSTGVIHTSLPEGPFCIDLPLPSQWVTTPQPTEKIDYLALTRDRKHSSLGKEVRVVEQEPPSGRSRRLRALMISTGYGHGSTGQGIQQKGISFVDDSLSSWDDESQSSSSIFRSARLFQRHQHAHVGGKIDWPQLSSNNAAQGSNVPVQNTSRGSRTTSQISREIVAIPEVEEEGLPVNMSVIQEEGRSITPFVESTTSELGLGLDSGLYESVDLSSDLLVDIDPISDVVIKIITDHIIADEPDDANSVVIAANDDISSTFQSSNEDNLKDAVNVNGTTTKSKPSSNNNVGNDEKLPRRSMSEGGSEFELESRHQQEYQQQNQSLSTAELASTLTLSSPVPPTTDKPPPTYRVIASSKDGKSKLSRLLDQATAVSHLPVHHPLVSKPRQPKPSSTPFRSTQEKAARGRRLVDLLCQPNLSSSVTGGEKSLSPFYGLTAYNN